jgi:hypothetical protein
MEERNTTPGATERLIPTTDEPARFAGPDHLADPRALTILTTEHSSLLTARSLVYNEAFARAGMFLTFLTGTLVALGFLASAMVSPGSGFGPDFLILATVLLGLDLFVGLATLGRITGASVEELRAVQGMNRLRHAYLEMAPSLEPYISTSRHDDLTSVLAVYGPTAARGSALGNLAHGLTTTPGMVGTITAAVGGAFAASFSLLLGASSTTGVLAGLLGFAILTATIWVATLRQFEAVERTMVARFPSSPAKAGPAER